MTSQGTAHGRFQRAIHRRHVQAAEMAAREMSRIRSPGDAPVRAHKLHDPEAIELFITEEDARRALEDCLRDEPQWRGRLEVTEVELGHEHTSLN